MKQIKIWNLHTDGSAASKNNKPPYAQVIWFVIFIIVFTHASCLTKLVKIFKKNRKQFRIGSINYFRESFAFLIVLV